MWIVVAKTKDTNVNLATRVVPCLGDERVRLQANMALILAYDIETVVSDQESELSAGRRGKCLSAFHTQAEGTGAWRAPVFGNVTPHRAVNSSQVSGS